MKKIVACCLFVLIITMFAGCSLFSESHDTNNQGTISDDTQGIDAQLDDMVVSSIELIKSNIENKDYQFEYLGEEQVLQNSEGQYFVPVNEEVTADDMVCYVIRAYTENIDDPNADSEGTVGRFYVSKSTGSIYCLNFNNGVLEDFIQR